ncbi:MAG: hypothetical protein AAB439_03020 [Patescibacteria group bacterium]
MKEKKLLLFFALALILFGLGYVLSNSIFFDLCSQTEYACRELFNRIGDPLFYGGAALSLVFLILLFIPHAFQKWKNFAIWFVPLATLLFVFYPDPGSGDFLSPAPEQLFQWVSALYVLVSLGIIVRSKFKK